MRVVYACSLERGGPLSHVRSLAPVVARAGADVKVLCANEELAAGFRAAGVDAVARPLRNRLDGRGAAALWPDLEGADVVHTHDRRSGLLVRPLARLRGARSVHTLHGLPEEIVVRLAAAPGSRAAAPGVSRGRLTWIDRGVVPLEATLARLGTTVVPSAALAGYLARHGFPRRRLRVIPLGIDLERSEPRPLHEPAAVGTAANLDHHKGVDVLLEACARVERPVRLEVLGDGELRPELERRARELGVDARFHGFVGDARRRIGELDVFVLPTRGDNLPLSILEAMASAVPVVATRVGGIPELVADGETGFVVPPDDPPALADAIGRVLSSPDVHASLGRAAAARAAERFDTGVVARATLELYEELCGSST